MLTLSMDIRTTSRKLVENRMKREQEIAGRVAGRIHKSFKGDVSAHRLLDETGSFRGALYALAGIVRDYFDGTVSRKMSMAIMGVGDTVRRMEDAEMSMAASAKTGVSSFVDPEESRI
jgi:CO/xanthine dehydrogenase FAD-binding subunit